MYVYVQFFGEMLGECAVACYTSPISYSHENNIFRIQRISQSRYSSVCVICAREHNCPLQTIDWSLEIPRILNKFFFVRCFVRRRHAALFLRTMFNCLDTNFWTSNFSCCFVRTEKTPWTLVRKMFRYELLDANIYVEKLISFWIPT